MLVFAFGHYRRSYTLGDTVGLATALFGSLLTQGCDDPAPKRALSMRILLLTSVCFGLLTTHLVSAGMASQLVVRVQERRINSVRDIKDKVKKLNS